MQGNPYSMYMTYLTYEYFQSYLHIFGPFQKSKDAKNNPAISVAMDVDQFEL